MKIDNFLKLVAFHIFYSYEYDSSYLWKIFCSPSGSCLVHTLGEKEHNGYIEEKKNVRYSLNAHEPIIGEKAAI